MKTEKRITNLTKEDERLKLEIQTLKNEVEELRNEKVLFESVTDRATDGIFVLDESINYVFINSTSGSIMDHEPSEWVGKRAGQYVSSDDRVRAAQAFAKAFGGEEGEIEIKVQGSDRSYRTLLIKLSPLDWKGKRHVLGVATDLTKLEEKKNDLKQIEKEWQTILNSVPAMIFYKDKENRLIRINEAFAKETGMPKETEGKSVFELIPNRKLANAYWRDDKEVMRTGVAKRNIIKPLVTDEERWFQTDKIPYKDENW